MFGRRPKPNLIFSPTIKHAGNRGKFQDFMIVLGIENRGRGSAKSPFIDIKVQNPYRLSNYGVDGNGTFGLPLVAGENNILHQRFGSSQNNVIHPGVVLDVTSINFELDLSQLSNVSQLVINYQIAAEGINLISGQEVINVSEIPSKFGLLY
jgi:hypothetical protein